MARDDDGLIDGGSATKPASYDDYEMPTTSSKHAAPLDQEPELSITSVRERAQQFLDDGLPKQVDNALDEIQVRTNIGRELVSLFHPFIMKSFNCFRSLDAWPS